MRRVAQLHRPRGCRISSIMTFRHALAALVCMSWLQSVEVAQAGPVEVMSQVALQPGDPKTMVVRYTAGGGGLFYTHDGGVSWQLLCSSAVDPELTRGGSVPFAVTGDGKTMFGLLDGMRQDAGNGCTWSAEPTFEGQWLRDFAADPNDSAILYAITSKDGMQNGIWRRDASGAWSELGSREDLQIVDLKVARRGAGLRFYENVVRGATPMTINGVDVELPNYVMRVSDDEGTTWQEHAVAPTEGNVVLQAIDPGDPDRVVMTIEREGADDSIMLSTDQAATFTEYLTVSEFGGVALAADGRIWIGESGTMVSGSTRGLWFAASRDAPAQKLNDTYTVKCLAHEPTTDTLYACQNFAFGKVATDGTFTASLQFVKASEFLSCPDNDTPTACKAQLCLAYCGAGHFAGAPVCAAYNEPNCGPCADDASSEACLAASAPPVTGKPIDSGMPQADAAVSARPDAGPVSPPVSKKANSGCACVEVGAHAPRLRSVWALGLALSVVIPARLRRRRAQA